MLECQSQEHPEAKINVLGSSGLMQQYRSERCSESVGVSSVGLRILSELLHNVAFACDTLWKSLGWVRSRIFRLPNKSIDAPAMCFYACSWNILPRSSTVQSLPTLVSRSANRLLLIQRRVEGLLPIKQFCGVGKSRRNHKTHRANDRDAYLRGLIVFGTKLWRT
jgi:hypothetical protein